jgi:protein involved in sex pheromone biosynthesis
MKKVLALAFVATMVGLTACGGSKSEAAADSVTVDSTVAAQADSIATDSVAADSAAVK